MRLIRVPITILSLFVIYFPLAAQVQGYFEQANQAYRNGDYVEAVELYRQILDQGRVSGEVYFNLGNAYFKLNELGEAILFYEKAQRLMPGDEALQQNLDLARLRIVDKIEPLPQLFLVSWWESLTHAFRLDTWAWLTVSFFFLLMAFIAAALLFKRSFNKYVIVLSLPAAICAIIFVYRVYQFETSRFGVILDPKISVVGEPSRTGTEVFILHEGTKVEIMRSLESWYEIRLADGKTGWLQKNELAII